MGIHTESGGLGSFIGSSCVLCINHSISLGLKFLNPKIKFI